MDSGTNGLAAVKINRKFIGINSSEDSFKISQTVLSRINKDGYT
jgi:DNA modification methylase